MASAHLFLWAFLGWGLSSAFWMHIWLPDPPPPPLRSFITTSIAGIIGGIAGGGLIRALSSDPMPGRLVSVLSDPMPALGALAGSLILTGALLAATAKSKVIAR
jgi:hypothetical protein